MSFWLTFFSGSIAGGIVVWLAIKLFEHRLAKDLSASDRKAVAATEFRRTVNEAMSKLPSETDTWKPNNQTIRPLADFIGVVGLAVQNFAVFLGSSDKSRFTQKWEETKDYCQTILPRSMKGVGNITANQARDTFLQHVKALLSYAKET